MDIKVRYFFHFHDHTNQLNLVPRESLTESPPNEFSLADEDGITLTNFNAITPDELIKPIPIKTGPDQSLIDAFANTILQILEIKCNDPKVYIESSLNIEYRFVFAIVFLFK